MVMIRIITAVMIIAKYSLPTIDFATRYSTRYSDFLLQPYSNPTRSQKRLLVGPCSFNESFHFSLSRLRKKFKKFKKSTFIFFSLKTHSEWRKARLKSKL